MIYTPKKSQDRIPDKYTGGGILFEINGDSYNGLYRVQQGIIYAVDNLGNIIEQLYNNSDNNYLLYKQLNTDNDNYIIQSYYPNLNKRDYDNGNITRYFLKRKFTTDIDIVEVSSNVFNKVKSLNNAVTQLYDFIQLTWFIIGYKEDVKIKNYEYILEQEKNYEGIAIYLNNLNQFWKK